MVSARCCGSSGSKGSGRPCATSQKAQRRVHLSPMIMKVAVPLLKHSFKFGQEASSHTVCNLFSRNIFFKSSTFEEEETRMRIQSGLRRGAVEGVAMRTGISPVFLRSVLFQVPFYSCIDSLKIFGNCALCIIERTLACNLFRKIYRKILTYCRVMFRDFHFFFLKN